MTSLLLKKHGHGAATVCQPGMYKTLSIKQLHVIGISERRFVRMMGSRETRFGPICKIYRLLVGLQVFENGRHRNAASLSLIFCCVMDQHINVLARMPKPKKRLTPELADSLVDVFLYGVGSGKRGRVSLPPFAADQSTQPCD